jgi:hypothetical protein
MGIGVMHETVFGMTVWRNEDTVMRGGQGARQYGSDSL